MCLTSSFSILKMHYYEWLFMMSLHSFNMYWFIMTVLVWFPTVGIGWTWALILYINSQTLACMDWHCGGLLPRLKQVWRPASSRIKTWRKVLVRHLASYPFMSKKNLLLSFHLTSLWLFPDTLVHIYFLLDRSDSVKHVLKTDQTNDQPNLLVVTGSEVALVHGSDLHLIWRFNASSVLR